jgi:hypothetical protein
MNNQLTKKSFSNLIIEKIQGPLFFLWILLIFLYGIFILAVGWEGIDNAAGPAWGWAAFIAAVVFRFTFPITVGAFLAAKNIWEWNWFFALLFAAPGVLFMLPGLIITLLEAVRRR